MPMIGPAPGPSEELDGVAEAASVGALLDDEAVMNWTLVEVRGALLELLDVEIGAKLCRQGKWTFKIGRHRVHEYSTRGQVLRKSRSQC